MVSKEQRKVRDINSKKDGYNNELNTHTKGNDVVQMDKDWDLRGPQINMKEVERIAGNLLNKPTGSGIHTITGNNANCFRYVAVTPNGKFIVSGQDKDIIIHDFETKEEVHNFKGVHTGNVMGIAITPDSKHAISVSSDQSIGVFDIEEKKEVKYFHRAHGQFIRSVAVTPDGQHIISGCGDGSFKVFNLETKEEIHHFTQAHKGGVIDLTVTPDGKYVVTASSDHTVRVFDFESKEQVQCFFPAHSQSVYCVAVSPNGRYAISGSLDKSMKIFDLTTMKDIYHFKDAQDAVASITMTSDSRYIISCSKDGSIKVWDFETREEIHHYRDVHKDGINSVALSPDNRYIVSGSSDNSLKVFELEIDPVYHHFKNFERQSVLGLVVTLDGKYIVSAAGDVIRVFDVKTKEEVHQFKAHTAVSFDSKYIISGSGDQSIKIFELAVRPENVSGSVENDNSMASQRNLNQAITTEVYQIKEAHKGTSVRSLAITPDGRYIISSGSEDRSIKIFDFQTKEELKEFKKVHEGSIWSMTVTPDSRYLITGAYPSSMKIFDLQTKEEIYNFKNPHGHTVREVVLTPDCKYLVSASEDKSIKVWDWENRREIYHFKDAHEKGIRSIALTPDGRYIVSGSEDRSIKIFDLETKQQVYHFKGVHNDMVLHVGVTADGKYIYSSSVDKTIKLLNLPTSSFLCNNFALLKLNLKGSPSTCYPYLSHTNTFDQVLLCTNPVQKKENFNHLSSWYFSHHYWTLFHILAILQPDTLQEFPNYEENKVPFLVDAYGKTPLHYLFAHKKGNPIAINTIFQYILDFLEDHAGKQSTEFLKIMDAMSKILPLIISKTNPKLVASFLKIAYSAPISYLKEIPQFGTSVRSKVAANNVPILDSQVQNEIHKDGLSMIAFRCILINLPGRYSEEMQRLIFSLSEFRNEDCFRTKSLSTIIDHIWALNRGFHFYMAGVYSALMILLSIYIGTGDRVPGLEGIILAIAALFLGLELLQIILLRADYFKSIWNALDLIYFPLLITVMIIRLSNAEIGLARSWLYAFALLIGYMRWISYLRILSSTRTLIRVILVILSDMKGFIIIITMIILGFSLIFYEFERDEGNYQSYLLSTYGLLYGNYDTDNLDLSATLVLVFILFLLSVVLLNLLIAIMGDSYDKVQERRILTDSKERIEMILESTLLVRFFLKGREEREGYLIFCEPVDSGDDDGDQLMTSDEWEGKINVLKKMIKQSEKDISKHFEQKVNRLEQKTDDLAKEFANKMTNLEKMMENVSNILMQAHTSVDKGKPDQQNE